MSHCRAVPGWLRRGPCTHLSGFFLLLQGIPLLLLAASFTSGALCRCWKHHHFISRNAGELWSAETTRKQLEDTQKQEDQLFLIKLTQKHWVKGTSQIQPPTQSRTIARPSAVTWSSQVLKPPRMEGAPAPGVSVSGQHYLAAESLSYVQPEPSKPQFATDAFCYSGTTERSLAVSLQRPFAYL